MAVGLCLALVAGGCSSSRPADVEAGAAAVADSLPKPISTDPGCTVAGAYVMVIPSPQQENRSYDVIVMATSQDVHCVLRGVPRGLEFGHGQSRWPVEPVDDPKPQQAVEFAWKRLAQFTITAQGDDYEVDHLVFTLPIAAGGRSAELTTREPLRVGKHPQVSPVEPGRFWESAG